MEKIIHSLINNWIKGVDTYTHNGSTWLIFTDNKQWVIELTKGKTLWYNYNFFKTIFEFTSLDVVENQHYIIKWVEDNIIKGVNVTEDVPHTRNGITKEVLKYGVKETNSWNESIIGDLNQNGCIDTVIENGIKKTIVCNLNNPKTKIIYVKWPDEIERVIKKGVKVTQADASQNPMGKVTQVIKNGDKISGTFVGGKRQKEDVESVIGYGTKNPTD